MDKEIITVSSFGSACCSELKNFVDNIYNNFSANDGFSTVPTDPFEAVLALAAPGGADPDGLTGAEIETLCAAVNSRFIQEGHSEIYVSPGQIELMADVPADGKSRLGEPKESTGSSNKYCGQEIWGADALAMVETLTSAAGDVCFYGCFAAILYQSTIQRYDSAKDAFSSTVSSLESVLQQIIQSPENWTNIGVDFAADILSSLESLKDNMWGQFQELAAGKDWSEIMWIYIKSYVVRYKQAIVYGIIQNMVNSLISDLGQRASYYSILDQKLTALSMAISNLSGEDWWDDLRAAIQKSMVQINDADQSLQRAQIGATTGRWDERQLVQGKTGVVVAKNSISSVDMIYDTLKDLNILFDGSGGTNFRWDTGRATKNEFIEDLENLGKATEDAKDVVSCIALLSQKIMETVGLIELTAELLDVSSGDVNLQASVDVTADAGIITNVRDSLHAIYGEMDALLVANDRLAAPAYITTWNMGLRAILVQLDITNIASTIPGLSPFSIGGDSESKDAINQLNLLLAPSEAGAQRSLLERELGFDDLNSALQSFFAVAANMGLLMGDINGWRTRLGVARAGIREAEARDRATASFCSQFSGHESDELDMILDLLNDSGWEGAKKSLTQGKLSTFLSLGLFSLSAGTVMNCVASILDKEAPSIGITTLLNREIALQQAQAVASIRAPATLPAFQFKLVQGIAGQLRAIGAEISSITELKNEVC